MLAPRLTILGKEASRRGTLMLALRWGSLREDALVVGQHEDNGWSKDWFLKHGLFNSIYKLVVIQSPWKHSLRLVWTAYWHGWNWGKGCTTQGLERLERTHIGSVQAARLPFAKTTSFSLLILKGVCQTANN